MAVVGHSGRCLVKDFVEAILSSLGVHIVAPISRKMLLWGRGGSEGQQTTQLMAQVMVSQGMIHRRGVHVAAVRPCVRAI